MGMGESGSTARSVKLRRLATVWFALLALLVPTGADAAPGDLDPGFGENGQARLYGFGGQDIALQAGKILVTHESGIARLSANGVADGSFHANPHPLQDCDAEALGTQKNLKIIVGGCSETPLGLDLAVSRHGKDGFVDPTFGDGGIATTDFGPSDSAPGPDEYPVDLIVQPDDKIVAVGMSILQNDEFTYRTNWVLARYTANGALDTTFGTGGKVVSTFGAGFCGVPFEAARQTDGKILVVGSRCSSTDVDAGDVVVQRFHADGALDTAFGAGGTSLVDLGGYDEGRSVALQPDGKIVIAGRSTPEWYATDARFVVLRLDVAGNQDMTFGNAGVATIVTDVYDVATDVAIQPDGKIVVAGRGFEASSYYPADMTRVVLERFTADGQADATFGTGGRVQAWLTGSRTFAIDSYAEELLLLPDGKILVAGSMFQSNGTEEPDIFTFLARFASDASGPACTIVGTAQTDEIVGTPEADVICGGGGDDVIRGGEGNDIVRGGAGDDTIFGATGDDALYGDGGNDRIIGGNGRDLLDGGEGADTLDAKDSLAGDSAYGGAGSDVCLVDAGDVQQSCP